MQDRAARRCDGGHAGPGDWEGPPLGLAVRVLGVSSESALRQAGIGRRDWPDGLRAQGRVDRAHAGLEHIERPEKIID